MLYLFNNYYLFTFSFSFNKKSPRGAEGIIYMDGLVSTGNKFPYTILKRISSNQKKITKYFIHILYITVDKRWVISSSIIMIYCAFMYSTT
jgi:hypothetical protein